MKNSGYTHVVSYRHLSDFSKVEVEARFRTTKCAAKVHEANLRKLEKDGEIWKLKIEEVVA